MTISTWTNGTEGESVVECRTKYGNKLITRDAVSGYAGPGGDGGKNFRDFARQYVETGLADYRDTSAKFRTSAYSNFGNALSFLESGATLGSQICAPVLAKLGVSATQVSTAAAGIVGFIDASISGATVESVSKESVTYAGMSVAEFFYTNNYQSGQIVALAATSNRTV